MSAADAMPHVSNDSGGDDLCSSDEVKVFKEEGEEKRSSENLNELTEEQHDLIDLSESEVSRSLFSIVYDSFMSDNRQCEAEAPFPFHLQYSYKMECKKQIQAVLGHRAEVAWPRPANNPFLYVCAVSYTHLTLPTIYSV